MKKLLMAGLLVVALFLTACGSSGYANNGGWSESDWDMNYPSQYNNQTYCHNGTYKPLSNNQYTCTTNGKTTTPTKRPKAIVPPKDKQKPPVNLQKKNTTKQDTKSKTQQKPKAPSRPKAPKSSRK